MNKQKLEELTELLNKCKGENIEVNGVEDRVRYLIGKMNRLETDNIQSGGLYARKDELGGVEVGILIPVLFTTDEVDTNE